MLPHQPAELQQFPKVEPAHVKPEFPPQVASVDTLRVPVGLGEAVDLVAVLALDTVLDLGVAAGVALSPQVPKPDWQPVPQ